MLYSALKSQKLQNILTNSWNLKSGNQVLLRLAIPQHHLFVVAIKYDTKKIVNLREEIKEIGSNNTWIIIIKKIRIAKQLLIATLS